MRRILLIAILLPTWIGCVDKASAQMDCGAVIEHLNDTITSPGAFDVEFFVGKYGLEYSSCSGSEGSVFCLKCRYEAGMKSLEIVVSDNGLSVSAPTYGCRCGPDVKWKTAP